MYCAYLPNVTDYNLISVIIAKNLLHFNLKRQTLKGGLHLWNRQVVLPYFSRGCNARHFRIAQYPVLAVNIFVFTSSSLEVVGEHD